MSAQASMRAPSQTAAAMANHDDDDLTTFITTNVCRACNLFSSSKIRAIRSHCSCATYCREKIKKLKTLADEAGLSFSPWTQVTTRIHASNREVGGQQVLQRQQSMSASASGPHGASGSDGPAGAAAAKNSAHEILPDTGK
jgi:hypothetical protein